MNKDAWSNKSDYRIEDCCENGDMTAFIDELVTLAETYAR